MEKLKGIIVKGIGGFYYVEVANATYECKARGKFRKEKMTPLVGDTVEITVNENSENTYPQVPLQVVVQHHAKALFLIQYFRY